MMFVVMTERYRQIHHRRPAVRFGHDVDVIPLYRLHEAFCYTVTFGLLTAVVHGSSPSIRANARVSCAM